MTRKKTPIYGKKSFSLKMHDFDEGSRKVSGYFSAFGMIDSDSDMIMKGAFKKSIQEIGPNSSSNRKIQHLRMHDWNRQIGKILELDEDDYGLRFVSQLGRSAEGENAFLDYQDGIITEHSIGFNYIPDKIKFIETNEGGYFSIAEVKLWEGSAVTFGANEYTPVLDVAKGIGAEDVLVKLNERATILAKVLRNGKGTDERFLNIEAELLSLVQQYNDLTLSLKSKEPIKVTPSRKEPEQRVDNSRDFFLQLLK